MVFPAISPVLLAGCGALFVGEILHVIGVATPHWMEDKAGDYQGLFRGCNSRDVCGDIVNPSSDLKTVRAMVILGLVIGLGGLALAVLVVFQKIKLRSPPSSVLLLCMLAGIVSLILTVIGVGLYVDKMYKPLKDSTPIKINLGYSFALPIAGGILVAVAGILVLLGGRQSFGAEAGSLLAG